MSEIQKVRVVSASPASLWFVGFLFTVGYVAAVLPPTETMSALDAIGGTLLLYITWLIILGALVGGI